MSSKIFFFGCDISRAFLAKHAVIDNASRRPKRDWFMPNRMIAQPRPQAIEAKAAAVLLSTCKRNSQSPWNADPDRARENRWRYALNE
jgi:hypothetical protein